MDYRSKFYVTKTTEFTGLFVKGKVHPRTGHEGVRWGVGGQRHAAAALPQGKIGYILYRRLGGPPRPDWTAAENLSSPTGIRSTDRPARSESLYQLSYPGPPRTCSLDIDITISNLTLLHVSICRGPSSGNQTEAVSHKTKSDTFMHICRGIKVS